MKQIFFCLFLLCSAGILLAQNNVGIGTTTPGQKLEVNGGVKIGTASTNSAGTIRYNAGRFEGGDGANWKSLEGVPAGTIVCSNSYPNTNLENNGFSLTGYIDDIVSSKTSFVNVNSFTWLKTTRIGAIPLERGKPFIFWTGSKVIVFGGFGTSSSDPGYLYDPVVDSWTQMSITGVPSIFSTSMGYTYAVWTGTEMIVYNTNQSTGGRYNPATNTWTSVSNVNDPSSRTNATAIWTGTEMIVWGGNNGATNFNTGAKYNPTTNIWTATSITNAPAIRNNHTAIWTGTEMIIWGGQGTGPRLNTGGKYNPATDTWSATGTSTVSAPSIREFHTAIWAGTEMIVWGGCDGAGSIGLNSGGRYNPSTDSWASMAVTPSSVMADHTAVWTGTYMIVWGGGSPGGGAETSFLGAVYLYNPSSDSWSISANTTSTPSGRVWHGAVWAGNVMVVWGGDNAGYLDSGGRFYPSLVSGINTTEDKLSKLHLYIKN